MASEWITHSCTINSNRASNMQIEHESIKISIRLLLTSALPAGALRVVYLLWYDLQIEATESLHGGVTWWAIRLSKGNIIHE